MRTSKLQVNKLLANEIANMLAQVVTDLKKPEDALIFLKDFLSESELETLAKRLAVAYWLKKGRSYNNIKDNLKVSSATIASVQDMSKKTGFLAALKTTEADEWANIWAQKIKRFVGKKA